jgi:hypothetical protein
MKIMSIDMGTYRKSLTSFMAMYRLIGSMGNDALANKERECNMANQFDKALTTAEVISAMPEYREFQDLVESELHASRHALALSEVWALYYGEE